MHARTRKIAENIINMTRSSAPDGEIINRIGRIPVTVGSLRGVLSNGAIDDLAINGYMALLNSGEFGKTSYCMHTEFHRTIVRSRTLSGNSKWAGVLDIEMSLRCTDYMFQYLKKDTGLK